MISELNFFFSAVQFPQENSEIPYILDRNANRGSILFYIRTDVPPTLLISGFTKEPFFVEINLMKKESFSSHYSYKNNFRAFHISCIRRSVDLQPRQHECFILMGDFNVESNDATKKNYCYIYGYKNVIKNKKSKNKK